LTDLIEQRVSAKLENCRVGLDLQHDITVGSGTMYVVKSGDNLSNISKSFYGNTGEYTKIAEANNISNPDRIQIGQQLKIPAA
jgi:nucleoid-associated protein YgaU